MADSPLKLDPSDLFNLSAARDMLPTLGIEPTDTNVAQFSTYLAAFAIFLERNKQHNDLWREFGWHDSALHIRSKAARIGLVLRPDLTVTPQSVIREAPDLINYAVFFQRNVLEF